jgi:hypothetical protein
MKSFYEYMRLMSEEQNVGNPMQQPGQNPAMQQKPGMQQPAQNPAMQQKPGMQQPNQAPTAKQMEPLVNISDTPDKVLQAANSLINDAGFKKLLLSGKSDGFPDDEQVTINTKTDKTASQLIPTQSEIGTSQSLDDVLSNKFSATDNAIQGGMMGSAAGKFPVLTFGPYILDGHHRWSQIYATNPNAPVTTAEISAPGVKNPQQALNMVHMILYALYGKSPTKPFKGLNVFDMSPDQIREYAKSKVTDDVLQKLAAAKLIAQPNRDEAAQMFTRNLEMLKKKPGAYPRTVMPQPADAGDPSQLTQVPPAAAQGQVNFINPKQADLQGAQNAWYSPDGLTLSEQTLILCGLTDIHKVRKNKKKR